MIPTFKKYVPQGRFRSFEQRRTTIKLDKRECGTIHETKAGPWSVSISIKKEKTLKDPAPFRYITFSKRFDTESEAREWLLRDWAKIFARYEIYQFEAE